MGVGVMGIMCYEGRCYGGIGIMGVGVMGVGDMGGRCYGDCVLWGLCVKGLCKTDNLLYKILVHLYEVKSKKYFKN